MAPGKIILLNGPSSAGKSTLAGRLQARMPEPFLRYSIDDLRQAPPWERIGQGEFRWPDLRPPFHEGYRRSLLAFAQAGNNLVVDYIIETGESLGRLVDLLHGLDVFFIGLHCALPELERREAARGDRRIGEARADFETTHSLCRYDLELDSTPGLVDDMARSAVEAWGARQRPSAFERAWAGRHPGNEDQDLQTRSAP